MNIIEPAQEAGLDHYLTVRDFPKQLKRFASLVRAKREWVDLTDDEIDFLWCSNGFVSLDFANAVIAAFKEKNK